jgi:DNA-directed RNA polymerase subunit omega
MNPVLVKRALEKVPNPNILVNLVSRRVRQLNSGAGGTSRPLVSDIASLGAADIALREIIENKIGFDLPESVELTRPSGKNRRRPQHWARAG